MPGRKPHADDIDLLGRSAMAISKTLNVNSAQVATTVDDPEMPLL